MKLKVMSMLDSMKTMNRNIVPEVKFDNSMIRNIEPGVKFDNSMIRNIEPEVNPNIVTFVNPQNCKPFGGKPIPNQGCVSGGSVMERAAGPRKPTRDPIFVMQFNWRLVAGMLGPAACGKHRWPNPSA